MIVRFTAIVRALLGILSVSKTMVSLDETLLLVLILLTETLVIDVLAGIFELVADFCVLLEHLVFVGIDIHLIGLSSLVVQPALLFFLVSQVLLVPVQHCLVQLATLLNLIGKLRVLLSDLDLFLQTLFFIVQLAQPVF